MINVLEIYSDYKKRVDNLISGTIKKNRPESLYEPLKYLLSGGGKRIRPMMLIFSCEAAGGNADECINAAAAIELLHNFTLVHDDIMDNADTRRGRQTIHRKWNENVAILCGDQLIGFAYEYLLKTNSENIREIAATFTNGIIEVCEGQSYDKEFEVRNDVSVDDYLEMIGKKTAKMLEISAAIGALTGNADRDTFETLKNFAFNTGMAFQIQDDLLDISADENELGKKIGGDIIEGKKTYLLLKAKQIVNDKNDLNIIDRVFEKNDNIKRNELISEVKRIYEHYGVTESAKTEIGNYTKKAENFLKYIEDKNSAEKLEWLSQMLMGRKF